MEVTCSVNESQEYLDIIVAKLGAIGFEMFEESYNSIKAYIPAQLFNKEYRSEFHELAENGIQIRFEERLIPAQNWNELWESNFDPVVIADKVYIRADFHTDKDYPYTIIIHPKMAFGTGHHSTTSLMMECMLNEDFAGKRVMDMGCGTGILAILAHQLGAATVTAIDNDSVATANARENCDLNKAETVKVLTGDSSLIESDAYDIFLANINRNIILHDIEAYTVGLRKGGTIYFSGFYRHDETAIKDAAVACGLTYIKGLERDSWMCMAFRK